MTPTRNDPFELDLRTFPLEPLLRQALDADLGKAATAWRFLASLAREDRPEAETFLLGLMHVHRDDLARMVELVRAVLGLDSEAAAGALKAEFRRVPSSPATRTYLGEVCRALQRLPRSLAWEALMDLAEDETLSVKWRRRFEEEASAIP